MSLLGTGSARRSEQPLQPVCAGPNRVPDREPGIGRSRPAFFGNWTVVSSFDSSGKSVPKVAKGDVDMTEPVWFEANRTPKEVSDYFHIDTLPCLRPERHPSRSHGIRSGLHCDPSPAGQSEHKVSPSAIPAERARPMALDQIEPHGS